MSLYKQFKTNNKTESEGTWVTFGVDDKGDSIEFLLARAGGSNKKFLSLSEKLFKPHRRQLQSGSINKDLVLKLTQEIYAKTVVIDWKNVRDDQDNLFPFSVDNCIKLFNDLPEFFNELVRITDDINLYKDSEREEDVKN
jgi:hypothetical protein